jgi:pimeloyl-ACP methyl ester carboxylesterase
LILTFADQTVYYEEAGAGPPVLFIHGFAQSSYCWREVSGLLPGCRRVAVDLQGFGKSGKPAGAGYRVSDQARGVRAAIRELGLEELVLVGHSFGGAVALATAAELQRQGTPPRGLVLVDAVSLAQQIPWALRVLRLPVAGPVAARLAPARLAVRAAFWIAYHDQRRVSGRLVAEHARCMNLPGARAALVATARAMTQEPVGQLAPSLAVPALLIWGRQDPLVPLEVGVRLASALPDARLEILENCGHYPQQECPQETARLIAEFIEGL